MEMPFKETQQRHSLHLSRIQHPNRFQQVKTQTRLTEAEEFCDLTS